MRIDRVSIYFGFKTKAFSPKQILEVKQEQTFTKILNLCTQNITNKLSLIPKTTKHDYKSNTNLLKIDSENRSQNPFHISRILSFGFLEFEKTKELEVGV